jgi:hypothetical protein
MKTLAAMARNKRCDAWAPLEKETKRAATRATLGSSAVDVMRRAGTPMTGNGRLRTP